MYKFEVAESEEKLSIIFNEGNTNQARCFLKSSVVVTSFQLHLTISPFKYTTFDNTYAQHMKIVNCPKSNTLSLDIFVAKARSLFKCVQE